MLETEHTNAYSHGSSQVVLIELVVDQCSQIAITAVGKIADGEGAGVPPAVGAFLGSSEDDQRYKVKHCEIFIIKLWILVIYALG